MSAPPLPAPADLPALAEAPAQGNVEACATTSGRRWFDAWVATLPPERIRQVGGHLSIELRPGAVADALRDAMRLHVQAASASTLAAAPASPDAPTV